MTCWKYCKELNDDNTALGIVRDCLSNYSGFYNLHGGSLIPGTCLCAGCGFVDQNAHPNNTTGIHPNGGTFVLPMVHKAL